MTAMLTDLRHLWTLSNFMVAFGFLGEVAFGLRFIVQWVASERRRKSVVPLAFWYLSVIGATILLIYAVYRRDPVFIAGLAPTIPIYLRNLYFMHRDRRRPDAGRTGPDQLRQDARP